MFTRSEPTDSDSVSYITRFTNLFSNKDPFNLAQELEWEQDTSERVTSLFQGRNSSISTLVQEHLVTHHHS